MVSFDIGKKSSVIGRSLNDLEKYGDKGTAYFGKSVMSSGERPVLGRKILMDIAKPHVILICGKRGGGKSFSMAVLIEEFARQPMEIKKRLSVIVIDTVGIFWSLKLPTKHGLKELEKWDLKPDKTNVRVLVPKGKLDFYRKKELPIDGASTLRASELETA